MGVVKYSARATAVFVLLIGVAAADAPDFVLGLRSLAASETALLVIAVVRIVAGIVLINGRAFVAPAEDLATLGRATDPWRTAETRAQLALVAWQPWSPARVRFPAPEQPKALSMPPDERVRLRDRQDAPPLDQRRQRDERDPRALP